MQFFKKTKENTFFDESKTLTEIANNLETDKGTADKATLSWGKDWPEHICMGYTETYEKYMAPYRETPVNSRFDELAAIMSVENLIKLFAHAR